MHLPKLSRSELFAHREQAISMSNGSEDWARSAQEADWAALVQMQAARQPQVSSQPLILVKVRCSLGKPLTLISPSMKPAGAHQQSAQQLWCLTWGQSQAAGVAGLDLLSVSRALQGMPSTARPEGCLPASPECQGTAQEWCQHDECDPAGCWLCRQELLTLTLPACQHIHQRRLPRA